MKDFISFAALQGVAYFVLVANIRALAHLNYPMAAITEASYLLIQWTVLRRIVSAEGWAVKSGYIVGGTIGSLASMWLTRAWG